MIPCHAQVSKCIVYHMVFIACPKCRQHDAIQECGQPVNNLAERSWGAGSCHPIQKKLKAHCLAAETLLHSKRYGSYTQQGIA